MGEKEQATGEGAEARQNIKMASTMAAAPAEGARTGGPMKMATAEGAGDAEQYIKMGSVEGERWKGATGDLADLPQRAPTGEDDWTDTGKKSGGGGGAGGHGEEVAGDPGSSNQ